MHTVTVSEYVRGVAMMIDTTFQQQGQPRFTLTLRTDLAKDGLAAMIAGFDTSTYRILVLDDNYSMVRLVSTALHKAGFQVSTASSAEEGLELVRRGGLPHLASVSYTHLDVYKRQPAT